jgi:hypothetical protein
MEGGMNKYHILRETINKVSELIIGTTEQQAIAICNGFGVSYRFVIINGKGCMITSDCRMDRIGFVMENGIVIGARNG